MIKNASYRFAWMLFCASMFAAAALPAAAQDKPTTWTVVQVDDDFQALDRTTLKDFQKGINEKYIADLKAWQEAKKAAAKNKEKFTDPQPKKPKVKLTNKTFKTEEEASEYVEKARADLEKKNKKPKA